MVLVQIQLIKCAKLYKVQSEGEVLMNNEDEIKQILISIERAGIRDLIYDMEKRGFFESPASTRYHGCHYGGLAQHSLNVLRNFQELNDRLKAGVDGDSVKIASLLHDYCKAGAYIGTKEPYTYNKNHPKGHALLSLALVAKHIKLTGQEINLIKYHMGPYGSFEFSTLGEYPLEQLLEAFRQPECKLFYFADEMATIQEKCKRKASIC